MTELNLTDIRLLSPRDIGDAKDLAARFLAFNPDAASSDIFEYSLHLFAVSALQLIAAGYAEVPDVLVFAHDLAQLPALRISDHFTTGNKSATAAAEIDAFVSVIHQDPAAVVMRCHAQWQVALLNYLNPERTPEQPEQAGTTVDHKHPAFSKMLQLASARKNVLLVGPAGTGKTHAAQQVADVLGLEFASISVTAGMSVSQLTGWLMPGGYLESDFVRLYENGGVFLLDEMDAADANTLTVINQALANRFFNIAQRTGATKIVKHPDFICIAAANTFGTGGDMIYAGREQLDAATLDRFMTVFVDYDRHFEAKRCDPEVLRFTHAVRQGIATLKLRRVMSTRKALDMSDMVRGASRWTLTDCKECYFTGWSADEKARIAHHIN